MSRTRTQPAVAARRASRPVWRWFRTARTARPGQSAGFADSSEDMTAACAEVWGRERFRGAMPVSGPEAECAVAVLAEVRPYGGLGARGPAVLVGFDASSRPRWLWPTRPLGFAMARRERASREN
jgi:hypothetical protein